VDRAANRPAGGPPHREGGGGGDRERTRRWTGEIVRGYGSSYGGRPEGPPEIELEKLVGDKPLSGQQFRRTPWSAAWAD